MAQEKKIYLSTMLQGDFQREKLDEGPFMDVWNVGVGVAANVMVARDFSLGLGVSTSVGTINYESESESESESMHFIGIELGGTYFVPIVDKLYYVAGVSVGVIMDVSPELLYAYDTKDDENFTYGIMPLGLEYRPGKGNIGLRTNLLSLGSTKFTGYRITKLSATPSFGVNFWF